MWFLADQNLPIAIPIRSTCFANTKCCDCAGLKSRYPQVPPPPHQGTTIVPGLGQAVNVAASLDSFLRWRDALASSHDGGEVLFEGNQEDSGCEQSDPCLVQQILPRNPKP